MSRTAGQKLAVEQLEAIAAASGGGVRLGRISEPDASEARLRVEISVDCSGIEQLAGGIALRGRERLRISVPEDFPFKQPSVYSSHRRWGGTPHVHWNRLLCLYQATSEWDPQAGMYGLARRIHLWLTRAAAGELDPEDAPLHPPVQYGRTRRLVVVEANAPDVGDTAWIGFAQLEVRSDLRLDITGWQEAWPSSAAALAILLPRAFAWEYPSQVSDLFDAVTNQGIGRDALDALLVVASHTRPLGEPMHVVVATPMRRGIDGRTRHHVAVWEIEPDMADGLRRAFPRPSDTKEITDVRAELRSAVLDWARASSVRWCVVSENRPEIVIRRDDRSPVPTAFTGKKVVIWGCGAIGGHAAEWITRAGATHITLYDNDIVTPGVLVRQPYVDEDVGGGKALVLAARLREIRPGDDFGVEARVQNVITGPLEAPGWHEDADVLIDATASQSVRLKLEAVRRRHAARYTSVVTLLFGHEAERGVAAIAPPEYSGGPEDVLRQTKIECCGDDNLAGFAEEFWPAAPRTEHFQPEPGCSDTTFRGSAVEVAALTGTLLHAVATALVERPREASAHLHALPAAEHAGRDAVSMSFPAALLMPDGVGDYELRLSAHALADIRGWLARNDRAVDPRSETGGVLFGRRDEATRIVWIDSVIGPPPDSVASPQRFDCGTDGVRGAIEERKRRSRGELGYLGMWHTHPRMSAHASITDVSGMLGLVASQEEREAVMLIVGGSHGSEELAGYVFNGDQIRSRARRIVIDIEGRPVDTPAVVHPSRHDVGLALSGGGSRALAFHLGCLRALRDRGVLPRVRVVSGVSGGALMTALYAYGDDSFEEFDARVVALLRGGLHRTIARRTLLSRRLWQGLGTRAIAGTAAMTAATAGRLRGFGAVPPLRRWVSRTDAFVDVLVGVLGDRMLDEPRREAGLDVVINACDLRTGTAFRFGSRESSNSRLGKLVGKVQLATAVGASAAYPLLLPALDRTWQFARRDGAIVDQRVVLTDGGVYDNSATSCLQPGRSSEHTYNVFPVDYIIACDAGRGQLAPKVPFHAIPRLNRSFEASFRKLQDASRSGLHRDIADGSLKGFVMPYLGQLDDRLPWRPPHLIGRDLVAGYPTNFARMDEESLDAITSRGEMLTRLLIERWCPEL